MQQKTYDEKIAAVRKVYKTTEEPGPIYPEERVRLDREKYKTFRHMPEEGSECPIWKKSYKRAYCEVLEKLAFAEEELRKAREEVGILKSEKDDLEFQLQEKDLEISDLKKALDLAEAGELAKAYHEQVRRVQRQGRKLEERNEENQALYKKVSDLQIKLICVRKGV